MSNLWRRKPLDQLLNAEVVSDEHPHALRKTLGWGSLIALGIGAIIGAGLFVRTAAAAAYAAGPSVTIAFIVAAIGCAFAGLCYAEFASMIPIAGSAYTYSYATLGELVAWIIGWDLIIEYAIGNVAVAISWANYFNTLLDGFGVSLPDWLRIDYHTAATKMPRKVTMPSIGQARVGAAASSSAPTSVASAAASVAC